MHHSAPKMIYGQMLKAYRAQEGLSLRKLARRVGIDHSSLCRIENGQSPDSVTMLKLFAWAFKDYGKEKNNK